MIKNQEIIIEHQKIKKESQEIQKENQIMKKEYQEIKKEYQGIKKENEEIKKEEQIIKKECQEIKKENEEIKKIINLKNNNYNDIQYNKEQYKKELNVITDKALKDFQNVIDNKINNIDFKENQLMKTHIDIDKNNNKDRYFPKEHINIENNKFKNKKKKKFHDQDKINDNKIEIKIMNEKIEKDEFINNCKFININNIKIKNIGSQPLNSLYFVKDEKESSKDIILIGNDKNNKIHKLYLDGEFNPSEETIHSFNLKINYPKINCKYNLIIYIREKENGPNISNPLKIVINVKESDEERIRREQEKKERERQEEERIKKEEERKQLEEKEKKKINELFDKLNQEFDSKLQKEEIVQKIKEFNFDKYKIKEYINNKKSYEIYNIDYQGLNKEEVENLYNELDQEFNLKSIIDKEEVILKIIELRCDRDAFNDWIFEKL